MDPAKKLELVTEFDRALKGLWIRVFTLLASSLAVFLAIEFVVIFFVMSDSNVLRMQSMNGAFVMAGGLTVATITSLVLILPSKLIANECLKLTRQSAGDLKIFTEKAVPMVEKVDRLTDKIEAKLEKTEQLSLDLQAEGRMIREELAGLRKAFSTKIESPVKRIQPARIPLELTDGEPAEARAQDGNGTASG